MYTFCKKIGSAILFRDENGDSQRINNFECELFYPDDIDGDYATIFGKKLRRSTYPTIKEGQDAIAQNSPTMNIYGAKTFGYQYIRDKFKHQVPITPDALKIMNIDIETGRDKKGYSTPKEARCPVTSITIHMINDDQYYVWGYKPEGYIPKKKNVRYIDCLDEFDMLYKFIRYFSINHPHIITGWNCETYDIPYIVNRSKNIGITEKELKGLSPFGFLFDKLVRDQFGNAVQIYDIVGVSILDYLPLFKKFTYKTPENYKLDTIAYMILGDKKISYAQYGNLQNLYDENYELFIDYNIKDVEIVTRLDEKLNLFKLILSVAYKAGINYTDVPSPVTTWDVLIYNAIMDVGMVPPIDCADSDAVPYIGAYVKEPIPGLYHWIVSCDLNSLYPHLQMGINISPEKRVPDSQLSPELIDIRNKLNNAVAGIDRLLNEELDLSALKKYDVALAPNGQFYRRGEDGFIPKILEGLYNERKAVKRSMLDDKQKMEDDKELDLSTDISTKDTLQMALKILMNSEYGALANAYFRYFDIRNAEAVTSSGQLAILWVAKHLNIYLNQTIGTKDDDYVIAIDTDSVYLNLESLVNKFIPNNTTEEKVEMMSRWSADVLEPEIDRIYVKLAEYVNSHKQKMEMGREVIADKGFWTKKKRYALNVHDNEGVRYAKPKCKIMGLECVRSSTPEFARKEIEISIKTVLSADEKDVQDQIVEVKDRFLSQPVEDISFPRGVNNIEKWQDIERQPMKGTPIHVRAAITYNNYLIDNGFTDEKIQSGDKIKFAYLVMPNMFQSTVLGFPPDINPEAYKLLEEYIDKERQWMGTFYEPVDHIMKTVGWSGERKNCISDILDGEDY